MIERDITPRLLALFRQYPFVTVTGPRQSGKTTLCRTAFPELQYVNLEAPDQREFAESDPRRFLAQYGAGAILDEIQHVPSLLSYLQVLADEDGRNGLFVLTGSEQFRLSDAISQSLAGRTALLRLLPFSIGELQRSGASVAMDDVLYSGFYPRIHDRALEPRQALGDYFETYVERDLRRLSEIRDLSSFRRFVRLCAGRVGQLLNLSSLGADAGVSHTTARQWLTLLEASYIVFLLQPFHANIRKRLVRSPKLYFYDVGLAAYLVGIEHAGQVATHPLRGQLFESAVVSEVLKHRFNQGLQPNISFFRDAKGLECDLLYETGRGTAAIEIKSGSTISSSYFGALQRVAEVVPEITTKAVVYGGAERQSRSDGEVLPLPDLSGMLERLEVDHEIASFVRDRGVRGPDDSAVRTLDAVYQKHIRPTLEALETPCRELADALFSRLGTTSFATSGGHTESSIRLLDPSQWERTKAHNIVDRGFRLGSRRLELELRYSFGGYLRGGDTGFDVEVSVVWKLEAEGFVREVVVGGQTVPELTSRVPYSELDSRRAEVDRTVAAVPRLVMREIERLEEASA